MWGVNSNSLEKKEVKIDSPKMITEVQMNQRKRWAWPAYKLIELVGIYFDKCSP